MGTSTYNFQAELNTTDGDRFAFTFARGGIVTGPKCPPYPLYVLVVNISMTDPPADRSKLVAALRILSPFVSWHLVLSVEPVDRWY